MDSTKEKLAASGGDPSYYRPDAIWRDEVASRVNSYRARRRRRGDHSMHLDFGAPAHAEASPIEDLVPVEPGDAAVFLASPEPEYAPIVLAAEQPPEATKVIEFPRAATIQEPAPDELAEPLPDAPRILDIPDATEYPLLSQPLLGFTLDPPRQEENEPAESTFRIELPLQVAGISPRVFAALLDCAVAALAALLFGSIYWSTVAALPATKIGLLMLGATPLTFWALYQFIFLVYGEATIGMQVAALRVATFGGEAAPRRLRRLRALSLLVSCISLGLGFAWALLDEDTLCWHDRISHTHLTSIR